MNRFTLQLGAALVGAVLATAPALAETDVDQADSLRFNEFFKDKKDAVKVWKDSDGKLDAGKRQGTVKVYEQTPAPAAAAPGSTAPAASTPVPAATAGNAAPVAAAAQAKTGEDLTGRRYEIRERYTLTRSTKTPYSAFYVIEAMHQQMAKLCPAGWRKLAERSEPVEQDFYLYYELECL